MRDFQPKLQNVIFVDLKSNNDQVFILTIPSKTVCLTYSCIKLCPPTGIITSLNCRMRFIERIFVKLTHGKAVKPPSFYISAQFL